MEIDSMTITTTARVAKEISLFVAIVQYDTSSKSDTLPLMSTSLTTEEVKHVAKLSRLALSDAEIEKAKEDLSTIFEHISRLNTINTDGVEPLDHPTELQNRTRDDTIGEALSQQQVLANAPAVKDVYFDVPKVLGGDA
jgi:aspartyl-tRNA(Asn)/glutamyl-tRNA(Gln) amidotransferase subunit C